VAALTLFQHWLWERMADHDLTTTLLALKADVLDAVAEDWFAGRAVPDEEDCFRLAALFEVDPHFVLWLAGHRDLQAREESS